MRRRIEQEIRSTRAGAKGWRDVDSEIDIDEVDVRDRDLKDPLWLMPFESITGPRQPMAKSCGRTSQAPATN